MGQPDAAAEANRRPPAGGRSATFVTPDALFVRRQPVRNGARGGGSFVIAETKRKMARFAAILYSMISGTQFATAGPGEIQGMNTVRRVVGDGLITAGGALTLVLALVLFDDRVREQLRAVLDPHHPASMLSGMGSRVSEIVAIVAVAARYQSLEHAPLVIFSLAAIVLTIFMLRT
jgi:hypothetical protein